MIVALPDGYLHDEYAHAAHVFSADVTVYHAIFDGGSDETPAHLVECKPAALVTRVLLAKLLHLDMA
ncbi:hypothetical protein PQQ96_09300 [Paraburkholderia sediminicola]|uniref:hypothetical protein n=1 Tax=Paraburkholderia sediminicola TaxID=458836 RepID=UPI0038B85D9E